MIVKMNNTNDDFYKYMGRVFGSRIIQLKTNDRIYDDAEKEWFIYLNDGVPEAFVSVVNNVIKNVYTTKDKYLEELLNEVKKQIKIHSSIVPKIYEDIYIKVKFEILDEKSYKNFIVIKGANNE